MKDVNQALDALSAIRQQLSINRVFLGFGPWVIAATGLLAFIVGALELWLLDASFWVYHWAMAAVVASIVIVLSMFYRASRFHGPLALAMTQHIVFLMLPPGVSGLVIGLIIFFMQPSLTWLLPGLWCFFISLGLFSALKYLPRGAMLAAAWYFICGGVILMHSISLKSFHPAHMFIPFGVGQCLLASILYLSRDTQGNQYV